MTGRLNHSPADVVRWALIALGLGTEPAANLAWPIHVTKEPDEPDEAITIYNVPGRVDGRHMVGGETQEHPGIQVRVRAALPPVAWAKISQVMTALDGMENELVSINTVGVTSTSLRVYLLISVTRHGSIMDHGKGAPATSGQTAPTSLRNVFVANAVVSLRETT